MSRSNKQQGFSSVRIIGGEWRGRKVTFPCLTGLRPTPDRIRETLFNWLQPYIHGAVCLDMFAGSGVLGFEALSRGAKQVVMLDQSKSVVQSLIDNAKKLQTEETIIKQATFPYKLSSLNLPASQFNLVFLDPPYSENLIPAAIEWLINNHCLSKETFIYLEHNKKQPPTELPIGWEYLKQKTAGNVAYSLLQITPACL